MEKEKSRKIKNKMRLERSGDGDTCVEGEKTREKKRKEKENKRMDARKERKKNKKNKKSQLNVTIIFSQYFTINFK